MPLDSKKIVFFFPDEEKSGTGCREESVFLGPILIHIVSIIYKSSQIVGEGRRWLRLQ